MRKYVSLAYIIPAIYSSPAFSHAVKPETKFFQEQLKVEPMTGSILDYCNLIGISEIECRAEFYKNDRIDPTRLEAAKKCVEASGRSYRAAFDSFFKSDGSKQGLVSDLDERIARYHEGYKIDPKTGENHRHQWTYINRQMAGEKVAHSAVMRFKEEYENSTIKGSISGKAGGETSTSVDIVKLGTASSSLHAEVGGTVEGSRTGPSKEEIDQVYMKAYAHGYAYPEETDIVPSIYCPEGKPCISPQGNLPNEDAKFSDPKPATITKPVDVPTPDPTPKVEVVPTKPVDEKKPEIKKESAEALTQPIPTNTSTGGFDTNSNTEDGETKTPEEKLDGISTPVDSPTFVQEMNDCINRAERLIFKVMGSKTTDPDAQTAEEKKAEAEEKLKAGNCDESYYGAEFCQEFKNKQASHEAQDAEEKAKMAKEQALENFQKYGICDPIQLGTQFCQNAKALQDMDKDNPAEESVDGHVSDGKTVPDSSSTDPDGNGEHSIDGGGIPGSLRPGGNPDDSLRGDDNPNPDPLGRPRLPKP